MAELRTCEKEISKLQSSYEALRQGNDKLSQGLPPLTTCTTIVFVNDSDAVNDDATITGASLESSPTIVLERLQAIQVKLVGGNDDSLQLKMEKFRKRMSEKDPVTDKPRYGESTLKRVQTLLAAFEELQNAMAVVFIGPETTTTTTTTTTTNTATTSSPALIHEIKSLAQQEQERAAEAARIQAEMQEQERLQQEMMQQQIRQQELQAQEAARIQAQQQQAALEQIARDERLAQLQARQLAQQANIEWMNSIQKGPNGVREQLEILKSSTANDLPARKVAITALHTLFGQIVAHPENDQFRRIRCNHEQFINDIGQHTGGKEILIAAGFVKANIDDDIPCFISKEPNIENDMNGWATWFDLLKVAFQILQQEMMIIKK